MIQREKVDTRDMKKMILAEMHGIQFSITGGDNVADEQHSQVAAAHATKIAKVQAAK